MESILGVVSWIAGHYLELIGLGLTALGSLVAFLGAVLAIALIVPGEHPDKELQAAVDFLKKYNRK